MRPPSLTIGIEEEYQIVDPKTGELRSYILQNREEDYMVLREYDFQPEMRQSVVEIGTRVCRTPAEAGEELVKMRRGVAQLADKNGLKIMAAGAHPFSRMPAGNIPIKEFIGVKPDPKRVAQQHFIFGTHVHIGIEDREFLIDALNVSRYMLPHILCLSTSSPFWQGKDTGLKSYRSVVRQSYPRTGIPRIFDSWADYTGLVETLTYTNCIRDGHNLWWDVRPNWEYPTLEFRICDVCTRVDEAVCIAALFQAIIAKLWKLRADNMTFRIYPTEVIEENKWRAVRHGLDGMLIDFGKRKELPAGELINELVEWFIDDVVDDLGSRNEINYVQEILKNGTSADRQLATFRQTGSLQAVVKQLVQETNDLPG